MNIIKILQIFMSGSEKRTLGMLGKPSPASQLFKRDLWAAIIDAVEAFFLAEGFFFAIEDSFLRL